MLKIGYGSQAQARFINGYWERVHWRTTPSAGALYPFEVVASIIGEGTFLWDIETGRLEPLAMPALASDELAEAGLPAPPGQRVQALLVMLSRPWQSMRKYRLRGYVYCHLDVGHAVTNIALYSAALGLTPNLHLRFARDFMAARLGLDGLCREPLAVLSFISGEGAQRLGAGQPAFAAPVPQAVPGVASRRADALQAVAARHVGVDAAEADPPPVNLEAPEGAEIFNWEALRGILGGDCVLEAPMAPAAARLLMERAPRPADDLLPLPAGRPLPLEAAPLRAAILGRRSAKGYRDKPLSLTQIGELLDALRGDGVPADCGGMRTTRLGLRLVARRVTGPDGGLNGVYAYLPSRHCLQRVSAPAGGPVLACMKQQVAQNVAALVVLHAPIMRLMDEHGYSAFAELHSHAAQIGQRLHLAASRLGGVGLTCIAGFDGEQCGALAHLDGASDGEAIYVILLGVPDETAFKHDRLNVAWSHGHTTLEG
jgi:SagB-type dehydrogenase family enzyme